MALPHGTLPRLDQSPYDDPLDFVATWDVAMTLIEQHLAGSTGGSGAPLSAWFYKSGRPVTSPLPTVAPSPALGIWLPPGFQWMQNGEMVTVEEGEIALDLPPNFEGYATIEASRNSSGNWSWCVAATAEERSTLGPGSGIIGKISTDHEGLTSIDAGLENADIIYDMPAIAAVLRAFLSDDGDPETHPLILFLQQLKFSDADPRNAITVIEEMIALAVADIGNETVRENPELRHLLKEIGAQGIGITEVNPQFNTRSEATTIVIGTYGDGSGGTIDDLEEGTAVVDEDAKTIGPV